MFLANTRFSEKIKVWTTATVRAWQKSSILTPGVGKSNTDIYLWWKETSWVYLHFIHHCAVYLIVQWYLTLCDPMDYSPPGSSAHGDSPGKKNTEWVAMPSSRGSSQPRDQTRASHIAGNSFPAEPPGKPMRSVWLLFEKAWFNHLLVLQSQHLWLKCTLPFQVKAKPLLPSTGQALQDTWWLRSQEMERQYWPACTSVHHCSARAGWVTLC